MEKVRNGEDAKTFSFFGVGVENADMQKLGELSKREPLKLKGLCFRKLFEWLSNSQQSVSRSTPGDSVPLKNPAAPPFHTLVRKKRSALYCVRLLPANAPSQTSAERTFKLGSRMLWDI
ncbi:MAG: hypothetical protein O2960_24720 [Verrucomicrobia bacterium]|nr:hypothetical protein [Verrucomicrobiota bacterium]